LAAAHNESETVFVPKYEPQSSHPALATPLQNPPALSSSHLKLMFKCSRTNLEYCLTQSRHISVTTMDAPQLTKLHPNEPTLSGEEQRWKMQWMLLT
jgi:hypothetical protein